jgi:hypothetical protein
MSRGKQVPYPVRNAIRALAWEGVSAAEIERELGRKHWFGTYPVSLRTIQNVVKQARQEEPPDPAGPWSLADASIPADDVRLIRDVLPTIIGGDAGKSWPSREYVQWLVRVRRAAPDISSHWVPTLASAYRVLARDGKDTRYLDMVLVLRPWESENTLKSFYHAVRCARRLLGPPDVLRWVLTDLEVFWLVDIDQDGAPIIDGDDVLYGPCNERVRIAWS